MRSLVWVLLACHLLLACGDDTLSDPTGRFRLVRRVAGVATAQDAESAVAALLPDATGLDVVFAHDETLATGAATAARAAGLRQLAIVSGFAAPARARRLAADGERAATCCCPELAPAAVDLALLACSGVATPRQLPLGARWFTFANAAAGGTPQLAPGDAALAVTRRQNAGVLAANARGDVVFRIGVVGAAAEDAWLVEALLEAAAQRPQLEAVAPEGEAPEQAARRLVADNVPALLVVATAAAALPEVRRTALQQRIAVIVVGAPPSDEHYTTWIGPFEPALGAAAAAAVRQLLPIGGEIAELCGSVADPRVAARHQGFVDALRLKAQ